VSHDEFNALCLLSKQSDLNNFDNTYVYLARSGMQYFEVIPESDLILHNSNFKLARYKLIEKSSYLPDNYKLPESNMVVLSTQNTGENAILKFDKIITNSEDLKSLECLDVRSANFQIVKYDSCIISHRTKTSFFIWDSNDTRMEVPYNPIYSVREDNYMGSVRTSDIGLTKLRSDVFIRHFK